MASKKKPDLRLKNSVSKVIKRRKKSAKAKAKGKGKKSKVPKRKVRRVKRNAKLNGLKVSLRFQSSCRFFLKDSKVPSKVLGLTKKPLSNKFKVTPALLGDLPKAGTPIRIVGVDKGERFEQGRAKPQEKIMRRSTHGMGEGKIGRYGWTIASWSYPRQTAVETGYTQVNRWGERRKTKGGTVKAEVLESTLALARGSLLSERKSLPEKSLPGKSLPGKSLLSLAVPHQLKSSVNFLSASVVSDRGAGEGEARTMRGGGRFSGWGTGRVANMHDYYREGHRLNRMSKAISMRSIESRKMVFSE